MAGTIPPPTHQPTDISKTNGINIIHNHDICNHNHSLDLDRVIRETRASKSHKSRSFSNRFGQRNCHTHINPCTNPRTNSRTQWDRRLLKSHPIIHVSDSDSEEIIDQPKKALITKSKPKRINPYHRDIHLKCLKNIKNLNHTISKQNKYQKYLNIRYFFKIN